MFNKLKDTVSVRFLRENGSLGPVESVPKLDLSEEAWQRKLEPEQFRILRGKGTEPSFCGLLTDHKEEGYYLCAGCDLPLFYSGAKFHSGTGWPSFFEPVAKENIEEHLDRSFGMVRNEILCTRCGGHLGHVFNDGPAPSGLRYCLNSAALNFMSTNDPIEAASMEKATFAAGCFWGVETAFRKVPGVIDVQVGYTGGKTEHPSYEQVCTGSTNHAEAVEVIFDSKLTNFEKLLSVFWNIHNPTQLNRQGPDRGTQYRSAVFYHGSEQKEIAIRSRAELDEKGTLPLPVVTEITPASTFWKAEEYHQRYHEKHGNHGCGISGI